MSDMMEARQYAEYCREKGYPVEVVHFPLISDSPRAVLCFFHGFPQIQGPNAFDELHIPKSYAKLVKRFGKLMDRVSYKPDVTIRWTLARRVELNSTHVYISFQRIAVDSTAQTKKTDIHSEHMLMPEAFDRMKDEDFWKFLSYALRRMEQHECDEFFKVDGITKFDPHKGE